MFIERRFLQQRRFGRTGLQKMGILIMICFEGKTDYLGLSVEHNVSSSDKRKTRVRHTTVFRYSKQTAFSKLSYVGIGLRPRGHYGRKGRVCLGKREVKDRDLGGLGYGRVS